jgi:hypothetical protein
VAMSAVSLRASGYLRWLQESGRAWLPVRRR